jgi:chemotaxis protein CheX
MFGMQVVNDEPTADGRTELGGVIPISGGWNGLVAMGCSEAFARRLAAVMFDMEPDEMSEGEVVDAFGELVNVTTGNIKALLPHGCAMGTPTVAPDLTLGADGGTKVQLWGFNADGDHLTVVIKQAA